MDILFLNELRVTTTIGIYAWEQAIKQPVVFNLELGIDTQRAAQSENIEDALDYATVAERLTQYISANQYQLLETLAEQAAQFLLQEFQLSWLRLRVSKPGAVANTKEVGLLIERQGVS